MDTTVRKAFVDGQFYPGNPEEITELISLLSQRAKKSGGIYTPEYPVLGAVLPHAGHVYSGFHTVHFFESLQKASQKFDSFIILHPIHRGGGMDYATDSNSHWETPLGKTELDRDFIQLMDIPASAQIHRFEHSAEVILPFLQYYMNDPFQIVPVGICRQRPEISKELARKILNAEKQSGRRICILASSDFSHYLSPETGYKQDQKVVDAIEKLDITSVFNTIVKENISVCGYGPIMALMHYSKKKAVNPSVRILARGHSGEAHPSETVVDYISLLFYDKTSKNE